MTPFRDHDMTGGFAALYAASDCTVAQLRGTDGALNSAVAGGVVGIAWGLFSRDWSKGRDL